LVAQGVDRLKFSTSCRYRSRARRSFYLLRHTICPAVLTENLFMDNHEDCDFLLSKEGQQSLVDLHVDGITSYLSSH
jgi:N-acetylmuramoyl-L-alanine amidase